MNLKICYLKIDVSCEASVTFHHISQNAMPATDLHVVTTWHSLDNATRKNMQHDTSEVLRLPPATRNEATRRLEPPKVIPFAKLAIGTAIATSRERLRTAANGCERLQTVANSCGRLRT